MFVTRKSGKPDSLISRGSGSCKTTLINTKWDLVKLHPLIQGSGYS